MDLFLGADAGGTASKATLTTVDGVVLGTGAAGPGNPAAQRQQAAANIGAAIRAALGHHDPAAVRGAVVGVAGISGLADPAVSDAFERQWKDLGLTCGVHVVGDAVTAFAAGTTEPRGAVLIAGTGSVAALVDGLEITRTSDGHGWLLGDEGSGTWLGLQAVRSAVRRPSALRDGVFSATGSTSADSLVAWANRQPPSAFAALSPLVCTSDDPEADLIITAAVSALIRTLNELDHPGPVVLAGSLLTAETPIAEGVRAHLRARGTEPGRAADPSAGAARLAALPPRAPTGMPPTGFGEWVAPEGIKPDRP